MRWHHFSFCASILRLLLRRHELPVGVSALPYTKCADTVWSYVAVAPSTPYGTVPTMQIPLPQIQPVQPVLPSPQFQYTPTLHPPTLSPQMNPTPTTHLVQIPSTFHTLQPSHQPDPSLAWSPQTLIVAPQSYWPTHPQSVSPIATPTEPPPSTSAPLHPSQPPTAAPPHQQFLPGSPKLLH